MSKRKHDTEDEVTPNKKHKPEPRPWLSITYPHPDQSISFTCFYHHIPRTEQEIQQFDEWSDSQIIRDLWNIIAEYSPGESPQYILQSKTLIEECELEDTIFSLPREVRQLHIWTRCEDGMSCCLDHYDLRQLYGRFSRMLPHRVYRNDDLFSDLLVEHRDQYLSYISISSRFTEWRVDSFSLLLPICTSPLVNEFLIMIQHIPVTVVRPQDKTDMYRESLKLISRRGLLSTYGTHRDARLELQPSSEHAPLYKFEWVLRSFGWSVEQPTQKLPPWDRFIDRIQAMHSVTPESVMLHGICEDEHGNVFLPDRVVKTLTDIS